MLYELETGVLNIRLIQKLQAHREAWIILYNIVYSVILNGQSNRMWNVAENKAYDSM